jgi:hypothetical protein
MYEGSGKELSLDEKLEFDSLRKFINGISIERKKGKNGLYQYVLADIDGKTVGKLPEYYDGVELKEGKWLFKYKYTLETSEVEGRGVNDHREYDYVETFGGETVELYAILHTDGDVMFEGIREVEYVYKRDEFIIEIEPTLFKTKLANSYLYFSEPIRCVIDCEGEIIEDFANKRFFYDSINETYIK